MSDDLDGIGVFVAVAEARGFRAAGERLGVTGSAVSQALRRLEERIGIALVQRTTRSVRLTEVGERLYASVRPALDDLRSAVAAVSELSEEPRGTLRLTVGSDAEDFLRTPILAGFLASFPHVRLDLAVSNAATDIVESGYDAGIRLGEVIDRDMIAVPVSGDMRLAVVGAPSYFARKPRPKHPRDLQDHVRINWHPTPDAPPYRWEFTEDGRDFSVAVESRVITTEGDVNLRLACAGIGLTISYAGEVKEYVARGELVQVLEEFCQPFAGCYLFYPQRRHVSPALRAFIDYLRRSDAKRASKELRRRPARS
jgi:DNA-binding transcriptional LysR family regulator